MPISKIKTSGIEDSSVTADQLAENSVTSAKIGVDVIVAEDIANNAITVAELADNAVTNAKLADDAVDTTELVDGAVTSAKLDTNIDIAGTLDVTGVATLDDGLVVDNDGATVATFDRATDDGTIVDFQKDGVNEGAVKVVGSNLHIEGTTSGLSLQGNDNITPVKNSVRTDDAINLGDSDRRFKDLYLSGGVYLGGTGSDNYLDDYEEGTFTPEITTYTNETYSNQLGTYTKIGNRVFFNIFMTGNAGSASGGETKVSLPFAVFNTLGNVGAGSFTSNYITIPSAGLSIQMNIGQTNLQVYQQVSGGAKTQLNATAVGSSFEFVITGNYIAA